MVVADFGDLYQFMYLSSINPVHPARLSLHVQHIIAYWRSHENVCESSECSAASHGGTMSEIIFNNPGQHVQVSIQFGIHAGNSICCKIRFCVQLSMVFVQADTALKSLRLEGRQK